MSRCKCAGVYIQVNCHIYIHHIHPYACLHVYAHIYTQSTCVYVCVYVRERERERDYRKKKREYTRKPLLEEEYNAVWPSSVHCPPCPKISVKYMTESSLNLQLLVSTSR